jgi:hypothetical protein
MDIKNTFLNMSSSTKSNSSANNNRRGALLIALTLCLLAIPVLARSEQSSARAKREPAIPEASLPCTEEESRWWESLRQAGENVRISSMYSKEWVRFVELVQEGNTKAYRIPIPDRRMVFLKKTEPQYTEEARNNHIVGLITLKANLLPNGTVGEITFNSRLGFGLDQNCEDSARRTIFLPEVRDRKFVESAVMMEMNFSLF